MNPITDDIRDQAAPPETDQVNDEELVAPRDPAAEADDSDDALDGIDEGAEEEAEEGPDDVS